MTAFLYRPHVRRTITALFWGLVRIIQGGLGAALFIASIWAYAILTGAGIE